MNRAIDTSKPATRPDAPPLTFTSEAKALLTPFREETLNYIYQKAVELVGERLESALAYSMDDLSGQWTDTLDLALRLDGNWNEIRDLERRLDEAVDKLSASWSAEELDDYLKYIYFAAIPSDKIILSTKR